MITKGGCQAQQQKIFNVKYILDVVMHTYRKHLRFYFAYCWQGQRNSEASKGDNPNTDLKQLNIRLHLVIISPWISVVFLVKSVHASQ